MRIQLIFILTVLLAVTSSAKPIDIFFGTSGKNSEGIYYATFNPENGKFTPSKLAAKIGYPGFLANHPNGKIHIPSVAGMRAQEHWDIILVKTVNSPNSPG